MWWMCAGGLTWLLLLFEVSYSCVMYWVEQLCEINSYMPGHKLYTCDMIGQHETKKKKKSVNFFCFFEQQDK